MSDVGVWFQVKWFDFAKMFLKVERKVMMDRLSLLPQRQSVICMVDHGYDDDLCCLEV